MRTIHLNRRQARMLRENLTQNREGYDHLDHRRMDRLADKLNELQGEYGERMAALLREDREVNRDKAKTVLAGGNTEKHDAQILLNFYEFQDLNEEAETIPVDFVVEDGDYNLIRDKVDSQTKWIATDDVRKSVSGMLDAVANAEQGEIDGSGEQGKKVKQFRRK